MTDKVLQADIENLQTGGATAAALVNDLKRAINEVIDSNGVISTVPISKGGTGATTAEDARNNLGAATADLVTPSKKGLMSPSDKTKLDGLNIDLASIMSTGVLGTITLTKSSPTTISGAIDGAYFTDVSTGAHSGLDYTTFSNVTIPDIATQNLTYIAIDSNGVLRFFPKDLTAEQRRTYARLGVALHFDRTSISEVVVQPIKADDTNGLLVDFLESIRPLNISGNDIQATSSGMSIKRTEGKVFGRGINVSNSVRSPNVLHTQEEPLIEFITTYRDSGGVGLVYGSDTQLDFTKYDDGSGVLQTVSGSNTTARPVYFFPSDLTVSIPFGQKVYSSFNQALNKLPTDLFEQRADVSSGILLCWIVARADVTDLTAALAGDEARILPTTESGTPIAGSVPEGAFGVKNITGDHVLTVDDLGKVIIIEGTSNATVTIPLGLQQKAFLCMIKNGTLASSVSVVGASGVTVNNKDNLNKILLGGYCSIVPEGAEKYGLIGDMSSV